MRYLSLVCLSFLISSVFGLSGWAYALQDSVGVERKAGEVVILHRVSEGETLFGLSRRYRISVADLKSANSQTDLDKLAVGDTLQVPLFPALAKGEKTHHTIEEGETLFSIARQYQIATADLRAWNALSDAPIKIGQELIIYLSSAPDTTAVAPDTSQYVLHTVQAGETLYAISRAYNIPLDELVRKNQMEGESIKLGQVLTIREKNVKDVPPKIPTMALAPSVPVGDKKVSRVVSLEEERRRFRGLQKAEEEALVNQKITTAHGFAALIQGGPDTKKFLALHRNAPAGTILQVRNEMNDMMIFVRVIGKLPNTGINNKVDIRLSPAAYEKLGGIDERFPVEIQYLGE